MMKLNFKILGAVLSLVIVFTSCNKKKGDATFIPRSALSVMHLNINSIHDKIAWSEITASSWFQNADLGNAPSWLKSLVQNPEATGIALDKGLTFFVNGDSTKNTYVALTGTIDKENDFKKYNASVAGASAPQKNGDIEMVVYENEIVGWHKDKFIFLTANNIDGITTSATDDAGNQTVRLTAECVRLFKTDYENSLANVESFQDLINEKGDIQVWVNGEEINKYSPGMEAMSMFKSDIFFKDNFATFNISFENGEIVVDQKQYGSDEFMDYLKNNIGNTINEDMIERLPANPVLGVLSLKLKPAAIEELIKLIGADGLVNMFLQQAGFNLQDLTKANNGDILLAISRDKTTIADTAEQRKEKITIALIIGAGDKASAQKIADAARKMIPDAESSLPQSSGGNLSVTNNSEFIIFSNSSAYVNNFLNGTGQQKDFLKNMKGDPVAGFLDFQNLFDYVEEDTSRHKQELLALNKKTWKSMQLNGGKVKKGALQFQMKLHLQDQKSNSLKVLNDYFNQLNALQPKETEKGLDSLLVPPAFDTVGIDAF